MADRGGPGARYALGRERLKGHYDKKLGELVANQPGRGDAMEAEGAAARTGEGEQVALPMDPGLRATGDRVHTKKVRRGKQGGKLLGVFKESSKFERRKAKQRAKRAALKAIADQSGGDSLMG